MALVLLDKKLNIVSRGPTASRSGKSKTAACGVSPVSYNVCGWPTLATHKYYLTIWQSI